MTSLVARRIAELEATSGSSGTYSTTSTPRASAATTPAVYSRERLHVEPPNIASNDTQPCSRDARDDVSYASSTSPDDDDRIDEQTALPSPSSVVEPNILATPGIHHYHHHHHRQEYVEEVKYDHAGGYYSRPKRPVVDNGDGLDSCTVAAAVAAADSQQQQVLENRKMARKVAQLEEALALAHGRVAHLVSSSAKAAESASRRRRESEAAIAGEQACVGRICELEDSLEQAEKRSSWLQSELQVVWACSIQRVGELESELERTRRQQSKGSEASMSAQSGSYSEHETEHGYADASGESSLCGEIVEPGSRDCEKGTEVGDGPDQMMNETQEALYDLRAKFYRAMGERNKFKARCDDLEGKLVGGGVNTNCPSINSNTTDSRNDVGEGGDDDDDDYGPSNNNSDTEITDTVGSKDIDADTKTSVLPAARETTRDANKTTITSSASMDSTTFLTANDNHNEGGEENVRGGASYQPGTSSGSRGSASTRSTRSISSKSSNSSRATVAVTAAPSTTKSGKFSPWRWSPPARAKPRLSIAVDE